jgi:hypothetical protein
MNETIASARRSGGTVASDAATQQGDRASAHGADLTVVPELADDAHIRGLAADPR